MTHVGPNAVGIDTPPLLHRTKEEREKGRASLYFRPGSNICEEWGREGMKEGECAGNVSKKRRPGKPIVNKEQKEEKEGTYVIWMRRLVETAAEMLASVQTSA